MTPEQASRSQYPGDPADKARYVREMFAGIADRYDLLNDVLSFNLHKSWRRYAVRLAKLNHGDRTLDVCSGTGDFTLDLFRAVGPSGFVIGSDFCAPMVHLGLLKCDRVTGGQVSMMVADALELPYASCSFDCVTVGFGIRNVSDTQRAFEEMARVAKPGGRIVCLEFNLPRNAVWRSIVGIYLHGILPRIGAMVSRSEAYRYLPESIRKFYSREALTTMMERSGLRDVRVFDLNLGLVCIHIGTKPEIAP